MTVQAVEKFSPYSTITGLGTPVSWVDEQDALRILAYQIYEQIYWNVPETFKLVARGSDDSPIYIPTARTIVDTTNRFLCPNPGFIMDPDIGSPSEQEQARIWYTRLFRRERFWSQFASNKRYGLIRGDWIFHVLGDSNKPAGRRIKIETVDPAAYIPITHPDDPDKIIGAHLIEQFEKDKKIFVKRQTYVKGADPINNDGSDTTIYNSIAVFDIEAWQNLDDNPITVIKPPTALPTQITAIPIYHIKNIETPGDPFGSSELRGFERIMAAVNQAVSDEELALALDGLGLYATDGGPPRDAQGNLTNWLLGPGMVVEHGTGSKFERVTGVGSVTPVQDHLKFLIGQLKEASATPDAAIGKVDVQVAESGISLIMQLGPLLAKCEEHEEYITDTITQMFFDLGDWLSAYELFTSDCVALPIWGSPLPDNRDKKFQEILSIVAAGLADAAWAHEQLALLGYDFPSDMATRIISEAQARARAVDPFAERMAAEDELDNV